MEFSGSSAGSGSGRGEQDFPLFLDFPLSGGLHPLENTHRHIIHSLVKPSQLPLPGDSQIWETPKRRSPECEFGDATAILKSLKLNPDAAVFEFTSPTNSNPPDLDLDRNDVDTISGNMQGINLSDKLSPQSRKLSASSAPFVPTHNNVPNIQIPFPTSHAQTIHINNLTANLNYHVQPQPHIPQPQPTVTLAGAQPVPISSSKIVSGSGGGGVSAGQVVGPPGISFAGGSAITGSPGISFTGGSTITGGGGASAGPMPFTVNGAFPEYINQYHSPQQFQPPVLVYQDPSINHTLYYPNSNQQQGVPFNKDQQQQQQQPQQQPQQPKYTGPPIVSVKEKLAAPEEDIIPNVGQQHVVPSPPAQQQYNYASALQYNNKVEFPQQAQYSHQQTQVQQPASSQTQVGQIQSQSGYQQTQVGQMNYQAQQVAGQMANQPQDIQPGNMGQAGQMGNLPQPVHMTNQPTVNQARSSAGQAGGLFDSRDIQPQTQQHHGYNQQQQQHKQQFQQQQMQQQMNQYQQKNVADNTMSFTQHQQPSDSIPPAFGGPERAPAAKMVSPPREPRYHGVEQGLTGSANDHNVEASISFGSYDEEVYIEPEPTKEIEKVRVERTPSVPFQPTPVKAAPVQAAPVQSADVQAVPVQAAPVQADPVQTAPAAPLTWANKLFTKPEQSQAANEKPTARIQPFSAATVGSSLGGAAPSPLPPTVPQDIADIKAKKFGEFLVDYKLSHYSKSMLPAGLSNRSNWCFVNAILQALVTCPPFFNLFKQINADFGVQGLTGTKTAMIQSILAFIKDFSPLDTLKSAKKEKKMKKEDVRTGACIEPASVYKMLLNLPQKDTFQVIEGRQEDAEEFLTCLLNGLSDEMAEVMKMLPKEERDTQEVEMEGVEGYLHDLEEHHDPDDWQEVDSKGRSCVTRRAVNHDDTTPITPIQSLALGMCRSSLRCETGEISATLQPFFTLQLDIQHPGVTTLREALLKNFDSEDIEGYKNPKTNQVVKATRSLNLEELPVILILHMKRFVYDANTGGVQKTLKPVQFSAELEIPKTVLSNETRDKFNSRQRQYKLFAVVCHNGREATKGHYVTDVFHTGYGCWLHCDDAVVTETADESVLTPSQTSTPYILFYRRSDTVVGQERREPKTQK